jgi:hypothetical protein
MAILEPLKCSEWWSLCAGLGVLQAGSSAFRTLRQNYLPEERWGEEDEDGDGDEGGYGSW